MDRRVKEPSKDSKNASVVKIKDCKTKKQTDTVTGTESNNYNSYARQESKCLQNEIHNSILTSGSEHPLSRENSQYSMPKENKLKRQYSTQKSNISTEEGSNISTAEDSFSKDSEKVLSILLEETNGFKNSLQKETSIEDKVLNDKYHVNIKTDETKVFIEKPDRQDFDEEKQSNTEKIQPRVKQCICPCFVSMFSCGLSVLAVMLVLELYTRQTNPFLQPDLPHRSHFGKAEATSSLVDSGSFTLDQEYLKVSNKIRWTSNEYSHIRPSGDGGCLQVPVGGKYLIVSRFTFNMYPDDEYPNVFHFYKVLEESGQMKAASYRRKLVSLTGEKGGSNKTVVIPRKYTSVFIEFMEMEQKQQICANVSRAELLYKSSLDNDLNIIRV